MQTYNRDVCVIKSPRAKIIVIPNSFLRSLSSQPRRRSVFSSLMPVCWDVALSRFLLFYVGIKLFRVFTNACVENIVDIGSV